MKKSLLTLLFLLPVLALPAQRVDRARLDSLFDRLEANHQGMGRISVFCDGAEVYARSYGYADLAANRKADENTVFRIASITKMFTAAVVMRLVEEGALSLADRLASYYPGLPYAERITVRDLLSHRSGYGRRFDRMRQASDSKEALFVKMRAYRGPLGEYGTYEYGNINFVLLTYIAEQVSGRTFDRLLDDIIIGPLGLKHTLLWNKDMARVEAQSYRWDDGWVPSPERDIAFPIGAGGLLSTPHDINVFIHALAAGRIVSAESLERMLPQGGYGLGVMLMNYGKIRGWGHNGVFGIYRSLLRYYPSLKLSVAITSNAMIYPNARIADDVLGILLGGKELPAEGSPRPAGAE